jgi:hypothetical protein
MNTDKVSPDPKHRKPINRAEGEPETQRGLCIRSTAECEDWWKQLQSLKIRIIINNWENCCIKACAEINYISLESTTVEDKA